jgi:hypothetical protein
VLLQRLRVVQHHVEPPGAAFAQEALQRADAGRVVEPQRGAVGVEDAQLAPRRGEEAIERLLESLAVVEALVEGVRHSGRSRPGAILR